MTGWLMTLVVICGNGSWRKQENVERTFMLIPEMGIRKKR